MRYLQKALLGIGFSVGTIASANEYDWVNISNVNSAELAATGWSLLDSSLSSSSDGVLITTTYWKADHGSIARCFDVISTQHTDDKVSFCEGAVSRRN